MPWYLEWSLLYLAVINVIGCIVTVYDKICAKRNKWRVSEKTLFVLSAIGGGLSVYITMLLIRHKTKHKRFMVGIPVIIALELILIMVITVWVKLHG
ncbi:MAG: DUF1294 domain-containing protein [Ruminococcus sp.]|nr:DUF1294 domain-containing protein [Ruminococcus sp.]